MWGSGYTFKDRWVLQDQIAHGSYSTVWRAQDEKSGNLVAVKNLRVGRDLESAKRALREVEMLKHFIGSENILQIMDVVIIPGIQTEVEEICIVTELMDFDLHSLITPGESFESEQVQFIMYQILCGVHIMQTAQTLHRDLKPKNILVNQDLTTKICDLGMGRGKMNTNSSLKMTLISKVATTSYRAPDGILNISGPKVSETASHQPHHTINVDVQSTNNAEVSHYTKAVDVWACGCILAEMITGSPLFPQKDNFTLLTAFVELLGCPDHALLERIPPSQALTQLKDIMQKRDAMSLSNQTIGGVGGVGVIGGGGTSGEHHTHIHPQDPRLSSLFPSEEAHALDLCLKLLDFDPFSRISIADALKHPYFQDFVEFDIPSLPRFIDPTDNPSLTLHDCNRLIITAADSFSSLE